MEPGCLGLDHSEVLAAFDWVGHAVFAEHFRKEPNRRQGRTQFVRDVADKVGFAPCELELTARVISDDPAADAEGGNQKADDRD